MPALIPELVNMASDPSVTTSDLLRRALVAARQLKQTDWATWISYELHGYPDGVELPSYRLLQCELKAMNPMRGMIPLIIDHAEFAAQLSMCRMVHSISALEALAIPGKNLRFAFSSEIVASLMHDLGISMVPERVLGANQVRALIDAVRDKLLMWSLDLQEVGILGEGMSFTPQEQLQARQLSPVTIHIGGDFIGGQLMVSSPGGQQQQTVTGEQKAEALAALLPWLAQVIAQGQLQREASAELQAELDTLKAQATSPKPKWPVIGAVAGSVRAILEGANGEVLAGPVLGWLATLTSS